MPGSKGHPCQRRGREGSPKGAAEGNDNVAMTRQAWSGSSAGPYASASTAAISGVTIVASRPSW